MSNLRKVLQHRVTRAIVGQGQLDVALDKGAQRALVLLDAGLQARAASDELPTCLHAEAEQRIMGRPLLQCLPLGHRSGVGTAWIPLPASRGPSIMPTWGCLEVQSTNTPSPGSRADTCNRDTETDGMDWKPKQHRQRCRPGRCNRQ